jgi:hypothetical protein
MEATEGTETTERRDAIKFETEFLILPSAARGNAESISMA